MALGGIYRPRLGAVSGQTAPADRSRWLRRLVTLALLVLLAELVYIPFHSARFAVTRVVLRGDSRVAAEVAAKIRLPANTNIFLARTGALVRTAESVPAVREASVARDWQRRLIVTLDRREAMAVIRGAKQAMLVDPNGVLFTIRNEWGWGLPELAAPHLSAGDATSAAAKAELAQLVRTLRELGPDPQLRIARLVMDRNGEMEIVLDSHARVRLGSTERLQVKTKLLASVLEQLGADRIEFLDLSDPLTAYWRDRTPPQSPPAPER